MNTTETEIRDLLLSHLRSVQENDIQTYHETTSPDLTMYEWWVTPQRIDGLPIHEFMMEANAKRGSVFGAEGEPAPTRFDLSNLHIQIYGEAAIASYTLLISTAGSQGVKVGSHNETRVMIKMEGKWKIVHVHKSPTYAGPHIDPRS